MRCGSLRGMLLVVGRVGVLFDAKVRKFVSRSCQHGLAASGNDRSLDELGMFRHYANQLFGAQILVGHVLLISGVVLPKRLLWLQSSTLQQTLEFASRERFFGLVNALKLNAFFSQDPLDLTALASSRLFVDRDLICGLHGLLLLEHLRRTVSNRDFHMLRSQGRMDCLDNHSSGRFFRANPDRARSANEGKRIIADDLGWSLELKANRIVRKRLH